MMHLAGTLDLVLLVLALACFIAGTFRGRFGDRVTFDVVSLGLVFVVLALLL
jgi:hypothetical protein